MSWKLAHNLQVREATVKACWPAMVVYSIGDQTHQAEAGGSDHNPDARGIVHAIDVMTETDAANGGAAAAILAWCLAGTGDLEYVIHDRKIYERSHGFKPVPYAGSDPHTNHVHISGKHGSTGRNAATGTGYDTAAEAMSPVGTPCSTTEDDMADIQVTLPGNYANPGSKVTIESAISSLMKYGLDVRNNTLTIIGLLGDSAKLEATIAAAVASLPSGVSVDVATMQAAFIAALKTLAADDTPAAP